MSGTGEWCCSGVSQQPRPETLVTNNALYRMAALLVIQSPFTNCGTVAIHWWSELPQIKTDQLENAHTALCIVRITSLAA